MLLCTVVYFYFCATGHFVPVLVRTNIFPVRRYSYAIFTHAEPGPGTVTGIGSVLTPVPVLPADEIVLGAAAASLSSNKVLPHLSGVLLWSAFTSMPAIDMVGYRI